MILQVALDTPLRRVFDYRPPVRFSGRDLGEALRLGTRVRVPFGRRQLIGVLVGIAAQSDVPSPKLRPALEILDTEPVLDPHTFNLLRWAAEYYHHPIGEVFAAALPASLRAGQPAYKRTESWGLSEAGRRELAAPSDRRGPQQRALLAWLGTYGSATSETLGEHFKPELWRALAKRGWILPTDGEPDVAAMESRPSDVSLTDAQASCVTAILASPASFAV